MNRRTLLFVLFVLAAVGLMVLAALNPPSGNSRHAGIFPALDIYRWVQRPSGPWRAAGIVLLADFGAIMFIRIFVEGDHTISRYWTFRVNDTLFIPFGIVLGAGYVLRQWNPHGAWYTNWKWHLLLLVLSLAVSLFLEYNAVKHGDYTMAQELSPSKFWHTVIFAVVGYWMMSALVPLTVTRRPVQAVAVFLVGLIGFVSMIYLDGAKPMTKTGDHREYNYRTGQSNVRAK